MLKSLFGDVAIHEIIALGIDYGKGHPVVVEQLARPQKKDRHTGNYNVQEEISDEVRGCLQSNYLSPTIFDLFSQLIMIQVLTDQD